MKNNIQNKLFPGAVLVALLLLACNRDARTPYQTEFKDVPPAPSNVVVSFGMGSAALAWEYDAGFNLLEFRIYRKDGLDGAFANIAKTTDTFFVDSLLVNGQPYFYEIAATNTDGFEGIHSRQVVVVPSIYDILIEGGAEATNSRNVTLNITAPEDTKFMMLSNQADFEFASWEPFAQTRFWKLAPGDGLKTVYAKFRTTDDQEIESPASSRIILDTVAQIEFLGHDGGGKILKEGDAIHLTMKTSELNGVAMAEISNPLIETPGSAVSNIRLYDNGTRGDQIAEDGVYEVIYYVGEGLEVEGAVLYGDFKDVLGNVSPRVISQNTITISQAPHSVTLQEPTAGETSTPSLVLRWTNNTDIDFASYQIIRSTSYLISLSSTLVQEVTDSKTNSYIDAGLEPATQYYYRIYVFDISGNYSAGNIVSAVTAPNKPPKPVMLSQAVQDSSSLKLSWSPSSADDFANYRLYRSTSEPVDTTFAPIRIINDAAITEFQDVSAIKNIDYFYQIFVFDKFGLSAGSNTVQGRIE